MYTTISWACEKLRIVLKCDWKIDMDNNGWHFYGIGKSKKVVPTSTIQT